MTDGPSESPGEGSGHQVQFLDLTGAVQPEISRRTIPEMREVVRGHLAYGFMALLGMTVLAVIVLVAIMKIDVKDAVALLAPIVGLVGTVLGFYFGGKS